MSLDSEGPSRVWYTLDASKLCPFISDSQGLIQCQQERCVAYIVRERSFACAIINSLNRLSGTAIGIDKRLSYTLQMVEKLIGMIHYPPKFGPKQAAEEDESL